jgi:predicted nucleic acid-binding Zn ribbon protein
LGRSVQRLVAERGWETEVAVGGVIGRWDLIVGPEVAAHCAPESYAEAVLTVRADSSAWATVVRQLAPTLVARLNEECGDGAVARVNVLGPGRPSWRKGALHVRGRGPRDTYG